jgi:hypothetical protein
MRLRYALLPIVVAVALVLSSEEGEAAYRSPACPEEPAGEGKDPGACPAPEALLEALAPGPEAAALESVSDTDVLHYFLDLEILPEPDLATVSAVRVAGTSTIDFEPTLDGLTTFTVDLHSPLTVNAVTGDVASWARVGDTVEVTLDRPYDTGESVQVAVDYEGYPQAAGIGAFKWWLRNGELVVATLSEPTFARYWWPGKDALDDKATMQMHVTVPDPLVALSNGVEVGSQAVGGGRTQYQWHETQPMIPYLASLAVTRYQRYELSYVWDDGGSPASMSVPCYVYPDHWNFSLGEPKAVYQAGCDELPSMLEVMAGLYGEYPFVTEKYGVVETGGAGGLAANMEHQTLSSMWRVDNYSDIMAHELAHQWWGDDVTCQTWYDIWLNEGFASYGEALYREFKAGGGASSYWARMNARRPSNPDAQVYRTSIATVGDIFTTNDVYHKGAWVVHMLRHVLGEPAFFTFLADYRADFGEDSATTDEFSASLSASFGHDLSWFAEQWVLNPGSPDYAWSWEAETIAGQSWLELTVEQNQDDDGYGLFTMPIELRVTTASGTTTHRIWNDDWAEYYVLSTDGPALSVEFEQEDGIADRNGILWDSVAEVAALPTRPPVLLGADVIPGAGSLDPLLVVLGFSEDVGSLDAADVSLVGAQSGAHAPDSVSYDALAQQATLTFTALPSDAYTLRLFDAGVSAHGLALDGETDAAAWWDDTLLPSGDGQPGGDATIAFSLAWPVCGDALDNDGDGLTDFPDDPGCEAVTASREHAKCQDGVNNDPAQDAFIDFDGGLSVLGYAATAPDPQCTQAWRNREHVGGRCGLGAELALLAPVLVALRARRRHR